MRFQTSSLLTILPALVAAGTPPPYAGMTITFQDTFSGSAGSSPDSSKWNIALAINTNNELQTYTTSNSNLQISGGGTIQFVPRKSPAGVWTSGRIETTGSWTPAAGKVMQVEASLRLGDNAQANKQGMWPAFWMLGDAMRHGTAWPACGEIDIFETVNGIPTVHGTTHCTTCNEPTGFGGSTATDSNWHSYAVKIDRTAASWADETITWLKDGQTYFTLRGATIGDQAVWATLAHSPLYILLNLAVGGDWPGAPNSATLDGYGSMMEVEYVAVYTT